MNAKERAEKILEGMPNLPVYRDRMLNSIAAQIEEAEWVASITALKNHVCHQMDAGEVAKRIFAEGFAAAREKAAGIVEHFDDIAFLKTIADHIREMKP